MRYYHGYSRSWDSEKGGNMNIFTLMGTILVDNTKANESLDKTSKEADSMMGKIGKGIGTVAKVGAAVGAAVVASGTALMGMATKSAEATDRIDKMSQRLGMSRQAFQEWDFITSQNGVSMDSMNTAMKSMTTSMASLAEGGKKGKETLGKLGISIEDLKNLNQEEIFEKAVVSLQGMDEGYEKARLAQQLFGKQGQEMLPMLNQSKGSIEELKQKAQELGLVLSDDAVDAGVKFADTVDQLKRSFNSVVTSVGVEVMPILQTLFEAIIENMPQIQAVIRAVFSVLSVVVKAAVDLIGGLVGWIQNLTDKNTESGKIIADLWESVKEIMKKTFEAIKEIIEAFTQIAKDIWSIYGDEISAATKAIWGIVSAIFTTAFNTINNLLDIFIALFKGDWEGLWTAVKKLVSDIWTGITKAMKAWLEGMVKIVGDIAKDMFNAGKKAMDNFFEGLKEPWKKVENWLNEKLGWVDRQFGKADTMGTKAQDSKGGKNLNGSHANGLEYVPFDGYIAELHQGERVLTADEARRRDAESRSDTFNITIDAKNVKEFNDIVEMAKEERRLRRMGEEAS